MDDLYLIDANVMLEAANTYYSFEHVPGFWQWLETEILSGRIRTASLVGEEIDFPDELVEWVNDQSANSFFIDVSDAEIQLAFKRLAAWLVAQGYGPEHVAEFLDGADPWIISAAVVTGGTVVTQERLVPANSKKVKIPNVCEAFSVKWLNTFQLMHELGAKLTP